MANKDDGGPAFPRPRWWPTGAGQVLQGLLADGDIRDTADLVEYCYHVADAMLDERGE